MASNIGMFYSFPILKREVKIYEQNGTKVVTEEDPVLAVVIVTPVVERAHSLPLKSPFSTTKEPIHYH
jgi:hypothetical protein